jgi:transcriptional regulator NrdR family protein
MEAKRKVMQTQLKVIKADGSVEEYAHTKVMGTINNALDKIGQADVYIAEQLAEVVTYFLYHQQNRRSATSSEIFSIIKAVLTAISYEDAAIGLSEHHFERRLKRSRTEVVSIDIQNLTDTELLAGTEGTNSRCRWDKSRIVEDLVTKYDLCQTTARAIASMVEEKIFNMGINLVPSSLIKQLVLGDTATVLRAQQQLQTA